MPSRSASPAAADLGGVGAALHRRLRSFPTTPLLRDRRLTVVLRAEDSWSLRLAGGRCTAVPGADRRWAVRVSGDADALVELIEQRIGICEAFLTGLVSVRGDLGVALALDGLFRRPLERGPVPAATIRAVRYRAGTVRTATLESGPPTGRRAVLLLHGLGATSASMLPLHQALAADPDLADVRVLAPDLPGFGGSDKPAGSYTAAWFADWAGALLAAAGVDSAVVVGNSMGGRVAIEVGLRSPERTEAVVGLCPSPAFRSRRQLVPLAQLLQPRLLATLPWPLSAQLVGRGLRLLFSDSTQVPDTWFEAFADTYLVAARDAAARRALVAAARRIYVEDAFGRNGFWRRLPQLGVPALFLWGDRDRLVPAGFARHVTRALPEAGSIIFDHCGHVPQMEHPQQTADVVRGFLANLTPAEVEVSADPA